MATVKETGREVAALRALVARVGTGRVVELLQKIESEASHDAAIVFGRDGSQGAAWERDGRASNADALGVAASKLVYAWVEKETTLADIRPEVAALGLVIRRTVGNELRVNFKGGKEATAYYTTDCDDALGTARMMAKRGW